MGYHSYNESLSVQLSFYGDRFYEILISFLLFIVPPFFKGFIFENISFCRIVNYDTKIVIERSCQDLSNVYSHAQFRFHHGIDLCRTHCFPCLAFSSSPCHHFLAFLSFSLTTSRHVTSSGNN